MKSGVFRCFLVGDALTVISISGDADMAMY
jgi:hypothetical protein